MKEIRSWHTSKPRWWSDIGYHFVVRRSGLVEVGRPLSKMGAHCLGHNENSIGVCWVGGATVCTEFNETYLEACNNATEKQINSLANVCISLISLYGEIPIYGHNEMHGHRGRECPVIDMDFLRSHINYGISQNTLF